MHKIIVTIKRLTVHLYDDFHLRYWIEDCPNVYPNSINLSIGWITICWRL